MDYCLLQFDALKFFLGIRLGGLNGPDFRSPVPALAAWHQCRPALARSSDKYFGPGLARKRSWNFCPSRPGEKEKLKFWPKPDPARSKIQNHWPGPGPSRWPRLGPAWRIFFPDSGPNCLDLSDFKTSPFSCLRMINDKWFFCWWFILLQFIKTTD